MRKIVTILFILMLNENKAQIITTVAGNGFNASTGYPGGFGGDGGNALTAQLSFPSDVQLDSLGNMYIVDSYNNRVRRVDSVGIINTIIGNGTQGYSGDGGLATAAKVRHPGLISFDSNGNIFIADGSNNAIRKVNNSGIISTICGGNSPGGFSGDGGLAIAAHLFVPSKILFDQVGNAYITDTDNHRIRKIDISGIITTIAGVGTQGDTGDGAAANSAQLNTPTSMAFDNYGNLFFTDELNHRIKKIDNSGIISTVAGIGSPGYSGDGGLATLAALNYPTGIVFDNVGNLFFSDASNNVIRKIDASGIITTIIGNGTAGYSGDGGLATLAKLNQPEGLCFDMQGNLYFADADNHVVRKVTNLSSVQSINVQNSFFLHPNPASNSFTISSNQLTENSQIKITDVLGKEVFHTSNLVSRTFTIDVSNFENGIYFIIVKSWQGSCTQKIIVQH
ncbi:MAG: NHL domain-containing protein [Bacteroidia bacterium]